jgi:hypothetical protein
METINVFMDTRKNIFKNIRFHIDMVGRSAIVKIQGNTTKDRRKRK